MQDLLPYRLDFLMRHGQSKSGKARNDPKGDVNNDRHVTRLRLNTFRKAREWGLKWALLAGKEGQDKGTGGLVILPLPIWDGKNR